jgi:streptogramin lyase
MHQLENASLEGEMIFRNTRSLAKLLPALGLIAAAAASPLAVVEYQIPREGAFPHDPAVGSDGIVWYTDQANSFIGRLDPATGKITDIPTPGSIVRNMSVDSTRSRIWLALSGTGRIGKIELK